MPKKEKPMTLDRLAISIQKDFDEIRQELATKPSVAQVKEILRQETKDLREDVKMIKEIVATKADLDNLREELIIEINHGDRTVKNEERLTKLEKKVGLA